MEELLASADLSHLAWVAAAMSIDQGEVLIQQGRPAVLAYLKELGVSKLPDRQKLANALAKWAREQAQPSRPPRAPSASQPPSESTYSPKATHWLEWTPSGWSPPVVAGHPTAELPAVATMLDHVMVIDDVLTKAECDMLLSRAHAQGYESSTHQGRVNGNARRGDRVSLHDGGLAAEIFSRIAHVLPSTPPPLFASRFVGDDADAATGGDDDEATDAPLAAAARSLSVTAEGSNDLGPASAPVANHSALKAPAKEASWDAKLREGQATTECHRWGPASGVWESLRVLHYDASDFFLPHRDQACEVGYSGFLPEYVASRPALAPRLPRWHHTPMLPGSRCG